ncbi:MAG: GreA/GreB family elongation factor [bacterium]
MKQAKIPFTKEGYAKLGSNLEELQNRRIGAVERLQTAREMGDLSENGAYKAARFEMSDIDRNIRRVTSLLKNGIVKNSISGGTIGFGSKIVLEKGGVQISYLLVSKFESEPSENKLSMESPLGMALVGKKVGEEVEVIAPVGKMTYLVKKVSG